MTNKIFPITWAADTMLHKWCVSSVAQEVVAEAAFRHDEDKLVWGLDKMCNEATVREWKDSPEFRNHTSTSLRKASQHHKENVSTAANCVEMVADWVSAGLIRTGSATHPNAMRYPTLRIGDVREDYTRAYHVIDGLNLIDYLSEFQAMADSLSDRYDQIAPMSEWATAMRKIEASEERSIRQILWIVIQCFTLNKLYGYPIWFLTHLSASDMVAMSHALYLLEKDETGETILRGLAKMMPDWIVGSEWKQMLATGSDYYRDMKAEVLAKFHEYADTVHDVSLSLLEGMRYRGKHSEWPTTAAYEYEEFCENADRRAEAIQFTWNHELSDYQRVVDELTPLDLDADDDYDE